MDGELYTDVPTPLDSFHAMVINDIKLTSELANISNITQFQLKCIEIAHKSNIHLTRDDIDIIMRNNRLAWREINST